MDILKGLFSFFSFLIIFATVMPLIRETHWGIRVFDFPRLQIAISGIFVFLVYFGLFNNTGFDLALLIAVLSASIWQLYIIRPYTSLASNEVKDTVSKRPDNLISLLVSNVYQPNKNYEGLLKIIREVNPDIILTLETNQWWEQKLASLEKDYPYNLKCPQDNLYGMHLYSRLPINNPQIRYLVEDDIPSMFAEVKMRTGHKVDLYCLHPPPPSPTENEFSGERDAELLVVGKASKKNKNSVIVTGDLNDVAWSSTTRLFKKISGLLDPRVGRGMFSTFHAKYWFLRWPLDHLFHSNDFTVASMGTLPFFGSDHFPIHITLCHEPKMETVQEPEKPNEEDKKRAENIIQEENAQPI